ncbi:hypothetical protein [Chlamydia vaughanii]|uniref:hypothetical protein n=1 Tax=Chlamydia vaughanii TaxID=3112552 RepID=UPI0032B1A2ED
MLAQLKKSEDQLTGQNKRVSSFVLPAAEKFSVSLLEAQASLIPVQECCSVNENLYSIELNSVFSHAASQEVAAEEGTLAFALTINLDAETGTCVVQGERWHRLLDTIAFQSS